MAYLRYGQDSDWYVFWYSDKAEAEQEQRTGRKLPKAEARLAVWHSDHQASGPVFTYAQVRSMLVTDDFSSIPGFESSHLTVLKSALAEFVRDVDREYRT